MKGENAMKLNMIERLIMKIFMSTFKKVYKKGLSDAFNFIASPLPPPNNNIFI